MPSAQPAPGPAAAPEPRRNFHLLFICLLVVGVGNSMLFVLLPPLVRRLGMSDATVGWVFSLSALIWVFASPIWGRVSDRFGRKPIIAFGLFAYTFSMAAFGLAILVGLSGLLNTAWVFAGLMAARAIFGAFGSSSGPAAQAYIADHTPLAGRTQALASLTAALALGQALGPALAGQVASRTNLVFPFFLVAGVAVVAAVAIWLFLPEKHEPRGLTDENVNLLALAKDPRIAAYLTFGFGMSVITGVLTQTYTLYLMDSLHVSGEHGAALAAHAFMAHAITVLITQMIVLPRLKISTRGLMVAGAAVTALGVGLQLFAGGYALLVAAIIAQGLGFGLARPGFSGGASMAVNPHEQGAAAGLVVAMYGAGFVFSPVIGGVAYDALGMHWPLYFSLAILAALVVFVLLSRRLRA